MKLLTLTCAHCDAPLEVAQESRHLICSFCAARLLIEGESTRVHSVPESGPATGVDRNTTPPDVRDEIAGLDESWMQTREHYRVEGTRLVDVPDTGRAIAIGMAIITIGLMITILLAVNTSMKILAPCAVIFLSISIHYLVKMVSRAQEYEEAFNEYRDRRIDLLRKL